VTQFQNIFIYDLDKDEWGDLDFQHDVPKWNHSAIMAPSIPNWKFFVFGGSVGSFPENSNRTNSNFVNDTWVLDLDLTNLNKISWE